jgi:CSLREA domain-containing protein
MRVLKALPAIALLLFLAAPAQAATFNVNSLADGSDATAGDGNCATAGGVCTLRAAVEESASTVPADEIVLGPGVHSVSPFVSVQSHDVTIRGAGARATAIQGTPGGQGVLFLDNTNTQIRDLRLTGAVSDVAGGGLSVGGVGSVLVERVAVTGNQVSTSGYSGEGGGVSKSGSGSLTIRSSLVSANSVSTSHPTFTYGAYGGGIAHTGGTLTVVNTTIEGNTATGDVGAGAYGGGFYTSAGTAILRNVTLARNSVGGPSAHGGNLAADFTGQVTVENTIVAQGTAPTPATNCYRYASATITPVARNLDSGSSCAFGAPHLSNTSAALGPLADNGGPTDSLIPEIGSAVIDAAIGCPSPAEDQRGVPRPAGAACEIGAVERVPEAGGGGGPPPPDVLAPTVAGLEISARRFRIGRATRRTRSLPRSTTFSFNLSEPSVVDFSFERRTAGRRGRGGRCQRPSRRNRRGRRCVRWLAAGSLADNLAAGAQSVRFDGDVTFRGRGRTLAAGVYRVRIEAADGAGNRSTPVTGRFQIVR